jgi:uncharacterized protein (DUF2062 family)
VKFNITARSTSVKPSFKFTLLYFQLRGKLRVFILVDVFVSAGSFMPFYPFGAEMAVAVAASWALSTCRRRHVSGAAQSEG